ncbi:GNAT family N-acetyltransferase [Halocatena salina]|uniref:GNAT family N-acetyltransferase n=1 Tax=Halocatena salina TaxID=2934340 RepID=A0A8U0A3I9_9EURY|nr:GNAT family N-acetyltransferase [Halocatena salina]UPM43765.1 GNAT family N-acetyltransferase [Halocatena salina]
MRTPEIRQAAVEDASTLAAVYRSAYQENRELGFPASAGSVSPVTVADWIRETEVYVATIDGEIVGGVRLELTKTEDAQLSRFGVHETYKGEGIGSELLAHAERRASDRGHTTIWLTTPEDHPYLPAFYRRRGYEKTGDYPLENRSYDEIVMEKQLR